MECSIATEWIVDKNALLNAKEEFFNSKPIQTTIPGVEYYIYFIPDALGGDIGFGLAVNVTSDCTIDAEYTLSIPSANFSESKSFTFDSDEKIDEGFYWLRREFFDPENFYIKDGKLTLQLHGTFKCKEMGVNKYKTIGEIFWEKDDKDFIIEVDDEEIKAHKCILRELSPYFAAMFDSGMKEAIENKVKIEGFPHKVVETAIKFSYTDIYHYLFDTNDYLYLLKFSELYDMGFLKTDTEFKLQKRLTPKNVCLFVNVSIEFNADKLRLCCMNFLIKCSKESTPVADFDSLDINFKAEFANKIMFHKI